ncbi:MAG: trimethylamine-N-oxide reductase TorA [Rhodospirillum sp.]|nr:trimethylamine-N-oxide reductase TorA [Rhodospirillum sp.]MCF8502614.1 trimethylamine-N-oxide reductase TorA [Rhodospirillum sp.]
MGHLNKTKWAAFGVTRRTFLEGTTLAGIAALAGPSLLIGARRARAQAAASGLALQGSHWGPFHAVMENGKFVAAKALSVDSHPTEMLDGIADSVYADSRIRYPMVRKGFLENGPRANDATRGTEDFVRVSWDQAIDLVSKELTRVKADHGNTAIFGGSYGWKSVGKLHNCRNLLGRLLNLNGGYTNHTGDYSTGASQVIMPHVVGRLEVYEQQTAWPVVVENSTLVVMWGADPMTTNQIDWLLCEHGGFEGMAALRAKGTRVIVIDPVRTDTVDYLNAEWIAPRPQTDVTIMLAIAHTLMSEGLADETFLDEFTVGWPEFAAYLKGEEDGVEKTADWAEGISTVPADVIRQLARDMAANRTMLMSGWSMQRMDHGEQAHWSLVAVASMLGQIGLPGGGFGLSYHYSNGGTPTANAPVLPGITATGKALEGAEWLEKSGLVSIPLARITDMLMNPGKTIDFNGGKVTYPDIKLIYWVGGNPFTHHQNTNALVEAWKKPETVIVHDMFWTPTARFADIVLPATTSYERNDIEQGGSYSLRLMTPMRKVIDPLFEARSDFDIFNDVAKKLGFGDGFDDGKDEMAWIRSFYEAALDQAKARNIDMPDFETFWNGDLPLVFEPDDAALNYVRYADYREDPLLEPLGTPSGKIELYSKAIEKMGYDDCPPHPTWMEPVEWTGAKETKFPLHVTTAHPKYRLHSQLNGSPVLRAKYTVQGREPVLINPADAGERGIKDGDVVRIFNDRGQVLAGAIVTDKVRPGVLRLNEGGWYDPVDPGTLGSLDAYGSANVLAVDKGTSKLAQGNCGHTAVADVAKYDGELPKVKVFSQPDGAA